MTRLSRVTTLIAILGACSGPRDFDAVPTPENGPLPHALAERLAALPDGPDLPMPKKSRRMELLETYFEWQAARAVDPDLPMPRELTDSVPSALFTPAAATRNGVVEFLLGNRVAVRLADCGTGVPDLPVAFAVYDANGTYKGELVVREFVAGYALGRMSFRKSGTTVIVGDLAACAIEP